jgi:dephospho-CoA kinase
MKKNKQIVIGVTGYLGSGKSTVLKYFHDLGFDTIDADRLVHELYKPGMDGWRKINDFFGEEYILKNGLVNRKKLGKTVFSNPIKLNILEKLVHPLVYNEINKVFKKSKSDFLALEAVKFDNKKLDVKVEYIIWVESDLKTAYKRFLKKRKISYKEFLDIVKFQQKPKKIDFVIRNNGTKLELKKKVAKVFKELVN